MPPKNAIYLSFSILALVAGCGGGLDEGKCPNTSIEIGTGTVEYENLPEESDLELVAGVQGGFHFIVHARATSIIPGDPSIPGDDGNPSTVFVAYFEDGERASYDLPPLRLGYVPLGQDCTYDLPSGRTLRVLDSKVDQVTNARIRIALRVEDDRGAVAVDEVWVNVIPDQRRPDAGTGPDAGPITDAGVGPDASAAAP